MTVSKRDTRPTLTLKGDDFTPEFRSLLNKAAKKAGKTQAEFAAEALAAAARRVLTGTPEDNPTDNPAPPPAVLAQIEDTQKRLEATDAKLETATKAMADVADQVRTLAEAQAEQARALAQEKAEREKASTEAQRGLWSRVFRGR